MTKHDLQIALECIAACNQSGLLKLENLVDVGAVANKMLSAIKQMEDGDMLIIQRRIQTNEVPEAAPEQPSEK